MARRRKTKARKTEAKKKSEIGELQAKIKELEKKLEEKNRDQLQETIANLARTMEELKTTLKDNPEKLLRDAASMVIGIISNPEIARSAGFGSGVNAATIVNELQRIVNGDATFQEAFCLVDNVWGAVRGYLVGDTAFKKQLEEVEKAKKSASKRVSNRIEEEYGA